MRFLFAVVAVLFSLSSVDAATITPAFGKWSSAGGSVDAGKQDINTMQVLGATFSKPGGKPTMTIPTAGESIANASAGTPTDAGFVGFLESTFKKVTFANLKAFLFGTPIDGSINGQAILGVTSGYATLPEAITTAAGASRTVFIQEDVTLTANITIPANIEPIPLNGAKINHGAYTISPPAGQTINTARWPLAQVFNGTGAVTGLPESCPEWFGVDGVNDGVALRKAIASTNGPVYLSRQYIVKLDQNLTMEGGATVCSIIAKSNMHLIGPKGVAKIKLADNESTDASPKYFNIIGGNTVLDNVTIEGITFDINGQNNKISPLRGSGTYNRYNCAAFMVSGSVATVGVDARLTNSKFLHNTIKNGPGVTSIGLAQSNSAGSTLGSNIEIAYNTFYNNGIDTDDHSSLYLWADNVKAHHNTFSHPVMSNGIAGPLVAVELHGSDNSFTDNDVINYYQGAWRAGNLTSRSDNQTISNNRFTVAVRGIGEFVETSGEPGIGPGNISDNVIKITGDYPSIDPAPKCGLALTPSYGGVGTKASNNKIFSTDTTRNVKGIMAHCLAGGRTIKEYSLTDNDISGVPVGIEIGVAGAAAGKVDDLLLDGGKITNVVATTAVPTFTFGVSVVGNNQRVKLKNTAISTRDGVLYAGVFTDSPAAGSGRLTDLHMSGLTVDGYSNFEIWDNSIVTGYRTGAQAVNAIAVPTKSLWRVGNRVENISGTVGQPLGWRCSTAGGAHSVTRANATVYTAGVWAKWDTGTTVWEATTAGTTAGAAPSIVGKAVGDTVVDGTVTWTMRSLTAAVFASEVNL